MGSSRTTKLALSSLLTAVVALLAAAGAGVTARPAFAQAPWPTVDAAELALALERLRVVGSVLYVAAHPDDENTALLAWLSKGRRLRTGYLALTRGDGGQNLIGSEIGPALGVIRTQELLAARRIDGAEQLFTRAIDFGYSKSPEETLQVWDREAVLSDVVRVVRSFRPDVLITRFPPDGRGGHGQHTASALLALEAFRAAGDPGRFPEQIAAGLAPWQPKRIFWNTWDPQATAGAPVLAVDVGAYDPLLGEAYSELAARSRSQHKSQGFGAAGRRGTLPVYLELMESVVEGEAAPADPFEGIDLTWSRLPGGEAVDGALADAIQAFEPEKPSVVLPHLARALERLRSLPPDPWLPVAEKEITGVMRAAAGLWLEVIAAEPTVVPGGRVAVTVRALNRSPAAVRLTGLELPFAGGAGQPAVPDAPLVNNQPYELEAELSVPPDQPPTRHYWLREPPANGLYRVPDPSLIGLPEAPSPLTAHFTLEVAGQQLAFHLPVRYRWTDPVLGERYRPVEIVPPVTVELPERVMIFPDAGSREVMVTVRAGVAEAAGTLSLALPPGFAASPGEIPFSLAQAGQAESLSFQVTPPAGAGAGPLTAVATVDGRSLSRELAVIDHPHIPVQTLLPPAQARLVRVDLATRGREIGYVMGAGDQVPEVLRQLGYPVTLLSDEDLAQGDLARFDAIVTGVRAYNTRDRLAQLNPRLLEYVRGGGTLVVQYNTSHRLVMEELAPFPLTLSRERITVEEAPVRLLAPEHPLLTTPNRITPADFQGWVQERGLYFPGEWDPRYQAVIASADPGEESLPGGLLYARYGDGAYVYTGYAFFRQLPAGVPGALRLFANLLAGGRSGGPAGDADAHGDMQ